jgi:type I restriction enzyme M protein
MSVYDPTVGSGGMLIQAATTCARCGADAAELALFGQEKMGTTWSICKMNMLLHGISHADIRKQDTLREPQHKDERRTDAASTACWPTRPSARTTSRNDIAQVPRPLPGVDARERQEGRPDVRAAHAGRAQGDGRMATVMPHGVLFRGGEEREARKHFIDRRLLEAVIGLPANLFYGTGIPACILVLNKAGAASSATTCCSSTPTANTAKARRRTTCARRHRQDRHRLPRGARHPAYARRVPVAEIKAEDYNCNIRRYVDNAPPPEPHDVRAHLHGGVPVSEIDAWPTSGRTTRACAKACSRRLARRTSKTATTRVFCLRIPSNPLRRS